VAVLCLKAAALTTCSCAPNCTPQPNPTARYDPHLQIPRPDSDPRQYQLALARTRQALAVQKAVTFMKAGEPAR